MNLSQFRNRRSVSDLDVHAIEFYKIFNGLLLSVLLNMITTTTRMCVIECNADCVLCKRTMLNDSKLLLSDSWQWLSTRQQSHLQNK